MITIENHEYIQNLAASKSALLFDLNDLPASWSKKSTRLLPEAFKRRPGKWVFRLREEGDSENCLTLAFTIEADLDTMQDEYDGITLVGLTEDGEWSIHLWFPAKTTTKNEPSKNG